MNPEIYGFRGCSFWLDASFGTNTTTDLAAVSSWQARIGDISFIQNTAANQPRYIASNTNMNNFPTIDFYDNARIMTSAKNVPFGASSDTMIIVAKYDTLNSINTVIGSSSNYGGFFLGGTFSGMGGCGMFDNGGGLFKSGTTELTRGRIFIATDTNITVDGTEESTFTSFTPSYTLTQLGRLQTNANYTLGGHIAEILIFNRKFTNLEISRITQNLNAKYALY